MHITHNYVDVERLNVMERSLGDQDVRDATIDKAHYLAQIGDKEESIKIFGTGMYSHHPSEIHGRQIYLVQVFVRGSLLEG